MVEPLLALLPPTLTVPSKATPPTRYPRQFQTCSVASASKRKPFDPPPIEVQLRNQMAIAWALTKTLLWSLFSLTVSTIKREGATAVTLSPKFAPLPALTDAVNTQPTHTCPLTAPAMFSASLNAAAFVVTRRQRSCTWLNASVMVNVLVSTVA